MLKQSLILSAFFLITLYASCPSYPYTPRNGVFGGGANWEYFCDDWNLRETGTGEVSFLAKGNDIYVGLFDSPNDSTTNFKYTIIIGGWSNTQTAIFTNNWVQVKAVSHTISNTNVYNQYKVVFNKTTNSIDLYCNGDLVVNYIDSNYQASNSKYITFSQYSSNVGIKFNQTIACPSYPYAPRNGVFQGGADWEYFCNNWNLAQGGTGEVNFQAKGNDIYIGLFDSPNEGTSNYKYAIIIDGWSNTQTAIYKRNWSQVKAVSHTISDTSVYNQFRLVFDAASKTIALYYNGNEVFNYFAHDYQASNAKYITFSQYGSNVVINPGNASTTTTTTCVSYPYSPRNGVFSGADWQYYCDEWKLPANGTGIVNFAAKGNDWYLGLFDTKNTKTFKYAIIFAGWSNSQASLYKNGDWNTAYASVKVAVSDVNSYNNYSVSFNQPDQTIAVSMNGNWIFSYYDPSYEAASSSWVSFSQYSSNVVIQEVKTEYFCGQDPSKFSFLEKKKKNSEKRIFVKDKLI